MLRPLVHGALLAITTTSTCDVAKVLAPHASFVGRTAEAPAPVLEAHDESTAESPDSASAELDAWEIASGEDGTACRAALKRDGFRFQAMPDATSRDRNGCGIPHGVVLARGPTGIAYEPPLLVDCSLARVLGDVERVVQEEADRHLGSKVVKIGDLGAFACRPRNYRKGGSLSAHAFGMAADLASFHPARGPAAVVDRDWTGPAQPSAAQSRRSAFLHAVYARLRARETDLTYIIGPDFNATHHNHFHLDRGGWKFWNER